MSGLFRKATKSQARLRMALHGPAKSGKTWTSLAIATGLGGRIAVIDTEHGSASKYADRFSFDVLELAQFDPRNYIEVIQAAETEGYDVLIIDSLSHAWIGKGGALEMVDKATARSQSKNAYTTGWREVTPLHNALIDAIVRCGCHLIATMRAKTEYVMTTNERGHAVPQKFGLAPVQRDGMEYEFDIVGQMTPDHRVIFGETRCPVLDGVMIERPDRSLAEVLKTWLSDGTAAVIASHVGQAATAPGILDHETAVTLRDLIGRAGMQPSQVTGMLARRGVTRIEDLAGADADEIVLKLKSQLGLMPFQEPGDHVIADPVRQLVEGTTVDGAEPPGIAVELPPAEDLVLTPATRPDRNGTASQEVLLAAAAAHSTTA